MPRQLRQGLEDGPDATLDPEQQEFELGGTL